MWHDDVHALEYPPHADSILLDYGEDIRAFGMGVPMKTNNATTVWE